MFAIVLNYCLESLQAIGVDELVQMAYHVTSSRVLDAVLESPTVPHKEKRKFVMTFIGHYHLLVDDRIGSRVGERCWAFADPYLKVRMFCARSLLQTYSGLNVHLTQEKIARSVIPYEHALAGSAFGKFFMRPLALHVLQRDPERWKSMQSTPKLPPPAPARTQAPSVDAVAAVVDMSERSPSKSPKGKGKSKGQDEIDALFDATLGKKTKKAGLASTAAQEDGATEAATGKVKKHREGVHDEKVVKGKGKSKKRKERDEGDDAEDKDLKDVLGAIRAAPKEDKGPKRKRGH